MNRKYETTGAKRNRKETGFVKEKRKVGMEEEEKEEVKRNKVGVELRLYSDRMLSPLLETDGIDRN